MSIVKLMPETLFISDLHLSLARPDKLALFKRLMAGRAVQADGVYILGDLFEDFWVGNDDRTAPKPEVIATLNAFTRQGGRLRMLRGNRELMLDKGIETATGCSLLDDGSVIALYGERVLIMHGDVLCTGDVAYQAYRRSLENPLTRKLYLSLPYRLRLWLAHGLRPVLKRAAAKKATALIDVQQAEVERQMRIHKVRQLIHGHTHRPDFHDFALDGLAAQRIVLGDWYRRDSVLVCDANDKKLMRVETYLSRDP